MPTTKKFLDSDGLVQYTTLVKRAIAEAADDHKVKHNSESGSSSLPILTSHQSNPTNGDKYEAGYDTALTYKPSTHEITLTDGTNTTKISPSGITLPSGAKPSVTYTKSTGKLNVTVGGQTSADASLAVADASNYGVVKVDPSLSTTSANPVQNQAAKAGIDAAAKTVRQTAKNDSGMRPILFSEQGTPTSGNNYEAGYNGAITVLPSTKTISVSDESNTTSISPTEITLEDSTDTLTLSPATIYFGNEDTIDASQYTGNAASATKATNDGNNRNIVNTYATKSELSSTTSGSEGAKLVGYSSTETVKDAIDSLYGAIGSGSGSGTLTGRVTALEGAVEDLQEGSNLVEGANITITPDTTNHTVTIAAADEKVSHTADTTSDGLVPVLFAGNAYNSGPSGVRYNSNLSYNPSGANLRLTNVTNSAYYTTINGEAIELKGANNSRVILSVDGFTGNAATATKATNDGNNNNIVNTYATKSELAAMKSGQFKVADSDEATAIAQGNASGLELGYIYLVEDTNASSPNIYDEYIKVAKGTTPETYAVEKIGTTDAGVDVVSLTTAEINTIWSTTAAAS